MTSGKGITHSERAHADDRGLARTLHGLQFWVALPDESEDCDPSFQHYEATSIPSEENEQRIIKVIAGEAWGLHSPVKVTSPLVFAEVICKQDFTLSLKKNSFELAAYIISGQAKIKSTPLNEGDMMVSEISEELVIEIKSGTHLIIIGGEPFTKPCFMWWNLVSS